MSSAELILFFKDFAGLFVAAILIFLAGRLLPKRARWFFWTAGFAIIAYELYLRINNRRILQELDQERASLKKRKLALEENNQALRREAETLAAKLGELEKRAETTFQELDVLKQKTGAQREQNAARIQELEAGLDDLQQRRQKLTELEQRFNLNSTLIREIDTLAPQATP